MEIAESKKMQFRPCYICTRELQKRRALERGAELLRRVRKEAHAPSAVRPILAHPGAVLHGVEPPLENAVRELAHVALGARVSPEGEAREAAVRVLPRVAPPRALARVDEGARSPVVEVRPEAWQHLEAEHAELIGAVDAVAVVDVGEERVGGVLLLRRHQSVRRGGTRRRCPGELSRFAAGHFIYAVLTALEIAISHDGEKAAGVVSAIEIDMIHRLTGEGDGGLLRQRSYGRRTAWIHSKN